MCIRDRNIKSESGNIENIMMMGLNPAKLAFNALDKTRKDNNWDITASGRLKLNDNISFESVSYTHLDVYKRQQIASFNYSI